MYSRVFVMYSEVFHVVVTYSQKDNYYSMTVFPASNPEDRYFHCIISAVDNLIKALKFYDPEHITFHVRET